MIEDLVFKKTGQLFDCIKQTNIITYDEEDIIDINEVDNVDEIFKDLYINLKRILIQNHNFNLTCAYYKKFSDDNSINTIEDKYDVELMETNIGTFILLKNKNIKDISVDGYIIEYSPIIGLKTSIYLYIGMYLAELYKEYSKLIGYTFGDAWLHIIDNKTKQIYKLKGDDAKRYFYGKSIMDDVAEAAKDFYHDSMLEQLSIDEMPFC